MILPIVAYGDPVLRKRTEEVDQNYPGLDQLIADMFDTMYEAKGVGLAAPQVGRSIRLFIVDATPFADDKDDDGKSIPENAKLKGFKKIFINARLIEEEGEKWEFNEGCLSIPKIREEVERKETILIEYFDEHLKKHKDSFDGLAARIIQHEYDHIEGKLFVDRISALRKRMLKGKLADISKGKVDVAYKMKFPVLK